MFNFFSNNLVYVDTEQLEIVKTLANEYEPGWIEVVKTPNHTVGTDNLLIFKDGVLLIRDKDYEDYNSSSIKLNSRAKGFNFVAILIKGNSGLEWGNF